jgi:molybdate transport system substrate-binding protein
MNIGRRRLFQASMALLPAVLAGQARADTTDLVVACDTAIGSAVRAAAAAFTARSGVQIRLFPTSPGLIVPQIERDVQNDLIVTQLAVLDQAARVDRLASDRRAGPWRNPLVLAALPGAGATDETIAVTDPSPASMLDGHAVLDRMGRRPTAVVGAVDTVGVAFLLITGAAQAGLLYLTDARAHQFNVLATVPDDVSPPVLLAAAISRNSRRPDPDAFLAFLAGPDATGVLHAAGLESAA